MNLEAIKNHVEKVSAEARNDMAHGRWDEVMTDSLYIACGAVTVDDMWAARGEAQRIATSLSFGTLHNYKTGAMIRLATKAEKEASLAATMRDGGAGVIVVDGVSCYVED